MKISNRIINAINKEVQGNDFYSNPLSFAYYLHFMLLNREQSAEQISLIDWAETYSKEIFASKFRTKQVDDEVTAAILIWKDIQTSKNKELGKISDINQVLSKHKEKDLYFNSFFHTIVLKYSLNELESYVTKDTIVKIIKEPKCLAFCQDLTDKNKKSIMFRINEELHEDKLNVFDEFYYYWYLFRNKTLDKKNGFMLKINYYAEQWYLDKENELPALSKALLYDITKRLKDGFYIVSEAELEGKGLTRFGPIAFIMIVETYLTGVYIAYKNWDFIIAEISKINLWQLMALGLPLFLGINGLFIIVSYSLFRDTILNSYPDKIVKTNLAKRIKTLVKIIDIKGWFKR